MPVALLPWPEKETGGNIVQPQKEGIKSCKVYTSFTIDRSNGASVTQTSECIPMLFQITRRLFIMERLVVSAIFTFLSLGVFASSALAAPAIDILVDEAKLVELNRPIAQVIIGNPAIADVAVQSKKVLVFTGKSAGQTNIILLDENNRQILNRKVQVNTANDSGLVIVHRGTSRSSYHCGTICNGQLAFGDDPKFTTNVKKNQEEKLGYLSIAAKAGR